MNENKIFTTGPGPEWALREFKVCVSIYRERQTHRHTKLENWEQNELF